MALFCSLFQNSALQSFSSNGTSIPLCRTIIKFSNIKFVAYKAIIILEKEFSGSLVRVLACSSGGRWFKSTHSITKIPLYLTVRFHSMEWIELGNLQHSGQDKVIMSKLQRECKSDIQCWIIYWMSGCGAQSKNIPPHSILVFLISIYIRIL